MPTSIKLFIFISLCSLNAISQKFKNIQISSISKIEWGNFKNDELLFLDTIFSRNDILILSESDHGDGTSADAQCMILKYLIDSNKIDAIYIEAQWMIADEINYILKSKGRTALNETIALMKSFDLKYWVDNGFWDYLSDKIINTNLNLRGVDVHLSGVIVNNLFQECLKLPSIQEYLGSIKNKERLPGFLEIEAIKSLLTEVDGWSDQSAYSKPSYALDKIFIHKVIEAYQNKNDLHKVTQWQGVLNFFLWLSDATETMSKNRVINQPKNRKQSSAINSTRDRLMAENFLRNYRLYNDKKIVLNVSSYHAIRNSDAIKEVLNCCKELHVNVMADLINKQLEKKIYSIAFINPYGHRGLNYYFYPKHKHKYIIPPKNSLEKMISKTYNGQYCFVDLQQKALVNELFYMRPVHYKYFFSRWSKNFSGVFYIKKMYPLFFKNPERGIL